MKYEETIDGLTKERVVILKFSYEEIMSLYPKLDDFDKALIKECEVSDLVADKLLMYEMIVRRLTEIKAKSNLKTTTKDGE